jgi:hypothetical protein
MPGPAPDRLTDSPTQLHIDNVGALTQMTDLAEARLTMDPTKPFYGEHSSESVDPSRHECYLGSKIKKH